jgi:hypothetical protein
MANDYQCPTCKGHLTIQDALILSIKKDSKHKGLILMNPEIGNYVKTTHHSFKVEKGVEYILYCPICGVTLNAKDHHQLVKLVMTGDDGKEYDVYFSGIGGEKCTYTVRGKKIEKKGPDVKLYDKYFEVPEEDKKYL